MSPQDAFTRQIQAFHLAIMDNCDRAARAEQTDAMTLRLRNNAAALAQLQLAMLATTESLASAKEQVPAPEPKRPAKPRPPAGPVPSPQDRMLSGDALSRFVSRRLEPDESPHNVWQDLLEAHHEKRRRNPALPGKGFLSPPG